MLAETAIYNTLKPLVSGRVYPDVAPSNAVAPYITYWKVGGQVIDTLDNAPPSKIHGRYQINVWGASRASVSALILQVEVAMYGMAGAVCKPIGSSMSSYEPDIPIFGAMQDFSIWTDR